MHYRRVSVAGVINGERERRMNDQNNHRIEHSTFSLRWNIFTLIAIGNQQKGFHLFYTLYSSLASRLFHEVCGISHDTFMRHLNSQ